MQRIALTQFTALQHYAQSGDKTAQHQAAQAPKQQRQLTKAVKRARILGIIPFTDKHKIESNQ